MLPCQSFGLVAGQSAEHGLAKLCDNGTVAVRTGRAAGQELCGHEAQAERIVEFAKGEQPGIGCDPGAMELQLEAAVGGDSQLD